MQLLMPAGECSICAQQGMSELERQDTPEDARDEKRSLLPESFRVMVLALMGVTSSFRTVFPVSAATPSARREVT
jgi:hypothetical protein